MIKSGDIVFYKKGNGFREVVLEDVLKMRAERGDVKLHLLSLQEGINSQIKLAISSTSDTETYEIVNELFNSEVKEHKPVENSGKIIKPLYLFLDKEILIYAKIKALKFKIEKQKKNKLIEFVDELEKKHPELKQAVVSGMLGMR